MSLSTMNPLMMPRGYSNAQQLPPASPQEWESIQTLRRTGWETPQQVAQQSDPYIDFINEFANCSVSVKNKILEDEEFRISMTECDQRIQAALENMVRPQVMQTGEGRILFERMLMSFRNVRDKYVKEESDNLEALQKVMQDDVVKKRIAELNGKEVNPKTQSPRNNENNNFHNNKNGGKA